MIFVSTSALFCGALFLLVVPFDWVIAVMVAAVFHELCHGISIFVCGGEIYSVKIKLGGAVIEANIPGIGKELLCTAAGPAGSFFLLLLCRVMPKTALCGLVQGMVNLLPIYPLDGGRILNCILELAGISNFQHIQNQIGFLFRLLLMSIALLLACRIFQG